MSTPTEGTVQAADVDAILEMEGFSVDPGRSNVLVISESAALRSLVDLLLADRFVHQLKARGIDSYRIEGHQHTLK